MSVSIKLFASPTHNEAEVKKETSGFLNDIQKHLGEEFVSEGDVTLCFIATGGTENLFKEYYKNASGPFYILSYEKANSLAASMEILSFLRSNNEIAEIIHGSEEYVCNRIKMLEMVGKAKKQLKNNRLAIIGEPSDWLIASSVSELKVKQRLGINFVRIPIQELIEGVKVCQEVIEDDFTKRFRKLSFDAKEIEQALRVYTILKQMIVKYQLDGLTIRCFDLLSTIDTTGCVALAILNALNVTATCEGDMKSLISMHILNKLIQTPGFQANPSQIDLTNDKMIFAHCSIPLNMCKSYTLDTHFESRIGVAIKGELFKKEITVFKYDSDSNTYFAQETEIINNLSYRTLCRTQIEVKLSNMDKYLLHNSIGNHHIIVYGKHSALIDEFMMSLRGGKL